MSDLFRASKWALAILAVICCAGLFFRLYRLGDQSLWIDEAYTINAADAILSRGLPVLDAGALYPNGMFETYAVALMDKIFPFDQDSPWQARLPAAVFGVLAVPAAFVLARKLFGGTFAPLSSAFLIAFLEWEVAWSRQARGYASLSLFLILGLIFALAYIRSGKRLHGLCSLASLLLAAFSHGVGLAFVPSFAGVLALRSEGKHRRTKIALAILGSALVIFLLSIVDHGIRPPGPFAFASLVFADMPVLALLAIFGALFAWIRPETRRSALVLTLFSAVPFLMIAFTSQYPEDRYLVSLIPFLVVLASYAALQVGETLSSALGRSGFAVAGAIGLYFMYPYLATSPAPPFTIVGVPQPDYKGAYTYIRSEIAPGDLVISQHPVLNQIYLGDKGVLLAMTSGSPRDRSITLRNGVDFYTGAPGIADQDSLFATIGSKHGFIVMESITKIRLPALWKALSADPRLTIAFESKSPRFDSSIWVFRF